MTTVTGSMSKFSKLIAAVCMLAMFGAYGAKATAATTNLGNLASPSTVFLGNTVYGAGNSFTDVYQFTVQSDSTLTSVLAAVNFYDIIGISNFASSLWSGGSLLAAGTNTTSLGGLITSSGINYSPLLAGPPAVLYEIHATGTVMGPMGSYGGAMATTPVPEPEVYAMLGVGLGLLGWIKGKGKKKTTESVAA